MKFLSEVPLMKRLPKDEHPIVAEACEAGVSAPRVAHGASRAGIESPRFASSSLATRSSSRRLPLAEHGSAPIKNAGPCFRQGDNGDAFYVVRTGEASVHLENEDGKKQVATLKAAPTAFFFAALVLLHGAAGWRLFRRECASSG